MRNLNSGDASEFKHYCALGIKAFEAKSATQAGGSMYNRQRKTDNIKEHGLLKFYRM